MSAPSFPPHFHPVTVPETVPRTLQKFQTKGFCWFRISAAKPLRRRQRRRRRYDVKHLDVAARCRARLVVAPLSNLWRWQRKTKQKVKKLSSRGNKLVSRETSGSSIKREFLWNKSEQRKVKERRWIEIKRKSMQSMKQTSGRASGSIQTRPIRLRSCENKWQWH